MNEMSDANDEDDDDDDRKGENEVDWTVNTLIMLLQNGNSPTKTQTQTPQTHRHTANGWMEWMEWLSESDLSDYTKPHNIIKISRNTQYDTIAIRLNANCNTHNTIAKPQYPQSIPQNPTTQFSDRQTDRPTETSPPADARTHRTHHRITHTHNTTAEPHNPTQYPACLPRHTYAESGELITHKPGK